MSDKFVLVVSDESDRRASIIDLSAFSRSGQSRILDADVSKFGTLQRPNGWRN